MLHTWSRDLSLHPHAHCIVTAAGLSLDGGRWADAQQAFLFPVAVLARLFRGRFLAGLCRLRRTRAVGRHLNTDAFDALLRQLYATDWNVYCKAPFAGPELSNAGFWAVGRLQTDADRERVVDSLANANEPGSSAAELSDLIRRLGKRWFLVRDVHSTPNTLLLQPRWALSFLRGPMTLGDVRRALERGRMRVVA